MNSAHFAEQVLNFAAQLLHQFAGGRVFLIGGQRGQVLRRQITVVVGGAAVVPVEHGLIQEGVIAHCHEHGRLGDLMSGHLALVARIQLLELGEELIRL